MFFLNFLFPPRSVLKSYTQSNTSKTLISKHLHSTVIEKKKKFQLCLPCTSLIEFLLCCKATKAGESVVSHPACRGKIDLQQCSVTSWLSHLALALIQPHHFYPSARCKEVIASCKWSVITAGH